MSDHDENIKRLFQLYGRIETMLTGPEGDPDRGIQVRMPMVERTSMENTKNISDLTILIQAGHEKMDRFMVEQGNRCEQRARRIHERMDGEFEERDKKISANATELDRAATAWRVGKWILAPVAAIVGAIITWYVIGTLSDLRAEIKSAMNTNPVIQKPSP